MRRPSSSRSRHASSRCRTRSSQTTAWRSHAAPFQLGLAAGDREVHAWGRLWSMDVHAATGQRAQLLGELAALTVLAEQLGPAWQARVLLVRASQALVDGRFDDAVRLAERRCPDRRRPQRRRVPAAAVRVRGSAPSRHGRRLCSRQSASRSSTSRSWPAPGSAWRSSVLACARRPRTSGEHWRPTWWPCRWRRRSS